MIIRLYVDQCNSKVLSRSVEAEKRMVQNTLSIERPESLFMPLAVRKSVSSNHSPRSILVRETEETEKLKRVRCTAVGHSALTHYLEARWL